MHPDPEFKSSVELPTNWSPDMFIYNSSDVHYDLLVSDDSRLAEIDPRPPSGVLEAQPLDVVKNVKEWQKVTSKRKTSKTDATNDEKLLQEENETAEISVTKDIDELEEVLELFGSKNSGYKRSGPQISAENRADKKQEFKCKICSCELDSRGLLSAHMQSHEEERIPCTDCGNKFHTESDLQDHKKKDHVIGTSAHVEWTCNDCPFQASSSSELMNHLRILAHQPSPNIKDRSKLFLDYRQCYTCKLEFDGYKNLMEHRHNMHPSKKKCRNFPDDSCTWGTKCWFVHEEQLMDVDESINGMTVQQAIKFNCNFCTEKFTDKNEFMKHKKSMHVEHVPPCNNYLNDVCKRSDSQCWYRHIKSQKSPSQPVRNSEEGNPWIQSEKSSSSQEKQQVFQEGPGVFFHQII